MTLFRWLTFLLGSLTVTFFVCTNRINIVSLQESSDRLVIIAKGFLKLQNLHMLIKQKCPSLPRNLALGTWRNADGFLNKVKHLLNSTARRCCLLHLVKQICLLKTFLRTLILMTWVSLYLFSFLDLT